MVNFYVYDSGLANSSENIAHNVLRMHEISDFWVRDNAVSLSRFTISLESERTASIMKDFLRTWNVKYNPNLQINNAACSAAGELAECLASDTPEEIKDELGDVIYYRYLLRYLMGDSLTLFGSTVNLSQVGMLNTIALLCDVGKKIAYHDGYGTDKVTNRYMKVAESLDTAINTIAQKNNLNIDDVVNHTVQKLRKRHGAQFTPNY